MIKILKSKFKSKLDSFKGEGELCKRIGNRHKSFWGSPDTESIKKTIMSASDPINEWKDVVNWQRKLSNKYNSREFAKMHGCNVPELYWKGRDPKLINFYELPKQYVIRPTIGKGCQKVFLMNDSLDMMSNRYYSNNELIEIMNNALNQNPFLEFLIEEFVRTEDGKYKIPKDYKCYMFNGEIARIEVINRLSPNTGSTSLYTAEWEQVENLSLKYAQAAYEEPPKCLEQLMDHARSLSKAYEIFVRIDFYATDKGAVFGEFTPTPGLGKVFSANAEKMLINYWDKYCKNMI